MNKIFIRNLFFRYIGFSIIIAVFHYLLLKNILPSGYKNSKPELIYAFLIPLQLAGLAYLVYRFSKNKTALGHAYLFFITLKLVASFLFLSNWFMHKNEYSIPFIAQFFCIFFLLLFAEIALLVKILNSSDRNIEKKNKNQAHNA